jgi:small-conductance mechanosensitive channel
LPIRKGEKFLIADTEVFHRQCAGLVRNSVRWQLEETARELKLELSRERSDGAQARTRVVSLENQLAAEKKATAAEVRTSVDSDRRLRESINRLIKEGNEERAYRADAENRERGLRTMNEQLIARVRELELRVTLHDGSIPQSSQPPATAPPSTDDKKELDPTEARFSLIEPHET